MYWQPFCIDGNAIATGGAGVPIRFRIGHQPHRGTGTHSSPLSQNKAFQKGGRSANNIVPPPDFKSPAPVSLIIQLYFIYNYLHDIPLWKVNGKRLPPFSTFPGQAFELARDFFFTLQNLKPSARNR